MQKTRSNSNPSGFYNLHGVSVLWHGWLKRLGRFSKRWRRRYFIFVSTSNGTKELRHYDTFKDVNTLLMSTPKGVISMTDATGICCFTSAATAGKKLIKFNRSDTTDSRPGAYDQKFAVLTPLHVNLLAFHNGREWNGSSESQQGLSLLASLSAFYPAVDVLHSGWMTKRRERNVHSPKSIMTYWKRHFFMFLTSGDLLYFRDDTLSELQGRVDVRHAPTVRVTGEQLIEERKKDGGMFKFGKMPAFERETCLIWIATPPSKMFVLKLEDDHEDSGSSPGISGKAGLGSSGVGMTSRKAELTPSSKKWLHLLLQGHAETKYTQLEKCIATGKYGLTTEIISAVRAGIPDELRGQLWNGFSGALELQRRVELKHAIRSASKNPNAFRVPLRESSAINNSRSSASSNYAIYEMCSAAIDAAMIELPENEMLFTRLCALALHESCNELMTLRSSDFQPLSDRFRHAASFVSDQYSEDRGSFFDFERDSIDDDVGEVEELKNGNSPLSDPPSARNTLKQLEKGKMGNYVYPSDYPAADWELTSRRRLLIASSRYNPYSHPFPWRVSCLLLAYVEEEGAFWMINSIIESLLPGYFHGHRPALQVDVAAFTALLEDRLPTLSAHLATLKFPLGRLVERWFLSLFTASLVPLPTVLRIWDAFFIRGVLVFYGVGIALLFRAEETLYHAKSATEVEEYLRASERSCIDADAVFSVVFKDDLTIPWLTDEQLEKLRSIQRQRMIEQISHKVGHFKDKLSVLKLAQDFDLRCQAVARKFISDGEGIVTTVPLDSVCPTANEEKYDLFGLDDDLKILHNESDCDTLENSFQTTLRLLLEQVSELSTAARALAAELGQRQAKWLAASSQLAACPLARLPTPESHSWLSQVKEGKISGAGQDMFVEFTSSSSKVPLAFRVIEASGMMFDNSETRITHKEAADSERYGQIADQRSCLLTERDDLELSDHNLANMFLYTLVSSLKALGAVRLDCLGVTYRLKWHSGSWLESAVEYPSISTFEGREETTRTISSTSNSRRSVRSTSMSQSSNPANSSNRRPRAMDDSALFGRKRGNSGATIHKRGGPTNNYYSNKSPTQLRPTLSSGDFFVSEHTTGGVGTNLYNDPIIEDQPAPSSPACIQHSAKTGEGYPFMPPSPPPQDCTEFNFTRSPCLREASSASNKAFLTALRMQHEEGEREFRESHKRLLNGLNKFVRLEYRDYDWALRERALTMERELQQEFQEIEAEVCGARWLH
ncbi:tbc1 domain family member 2a isoform x1 [Plasmopara halstedii]|uniref:Tbc1 domain family member 2a isoform x1 n=1 Tax=Plasmopara halstedii TaxID=4781 RepID=A0A0P1AV16_PLAHL|nr:tbc1 domain family member 2a isoform x1 [Plasmopara halstedii]CEG45228.1 tbc1 domain family member 2a isoform x1 [Plasmopara halstedii]|eukprot:XP_024581597.1 tbc1 domain family member 2a isoform x1 [Plasmopara halstedii]